MPIPDKMAPEVIDWKLADLLLSIQVAAAQWGATYGPLMNEASFELAKINEACQSNVTARNEAAKENISTPPPASLKADETVERPKIFEPKKEGDK